ncbi:FecR family protein [Chitinophaga parva]|uniref:FecR family protein n=1 Tax=Chitinophaga parva TaxID=2169414 RepID=UPI0014024DAA|nr:FecR domain-containing protein [Chitinophaga parva]
MPAPLRRTKNTRIFKIAGFSLAGAAVAASLLWMFIARPEITPGSREKTIVAAEKTTLTLSDGSMVCLSPGSRLSYPEVFDEQHRTVRLDGQAFFKVSKRPHQPFTVVSGTLLTEVLGTAFTIAAFPDRDKITVALVEGRVNVRGGHGQQHMLQPGMELVLDKNKEQVQVRPIGINDNITGWMSRELVFNDITLSEAAEQLQAVYGVHLVFENQRAANCRIWGKFSDRPLPEVLETIKLAGVAYQLKGKDSIYISAKK